MSKSQSYSVSEFRSTNRNYRLNTADRPADHPPFGGPTYQEPSWLMTLVEVVTLVALLLLIIFIFGGFQE